MYGRIGIKTVTYRTTENDRRCKTVDTDQNLISIATEKKETRYPAQMTLDELKEVLKKSREESKKGLGMTTEELRKRYPLCE